MGMQNLRLRKRIFECGMVGSKPYAQGRRRLPTPVNDHDRRETTQRFSALHFLYLNATIFLSAARVRIRDGLLATSINPVFS